MAAKKPYYNWYASDFLGSQFVQSLSLIEECCYRRLLDMQATSESRRISSDPNDLRRQCKSLPAPAWNKIWARIRVKFVDHPDGNGGLVNTKLNSILEAGDEFSKERSETGKRGAKLRWNKDTDDSSANSSAIEKHGLANGSAKKIDGKHHGSSMASISISNSIPPLIHPQSLINPSVPIQGEGERTIGFSKPDFQKFWGPVEKYLRGESLEEYFQLWFRGIRVLDMTSRLIVLAVPETFIAEFGGAETAAIALKNKIEKSGTGFMRDRGLKLVSLESITEVPVVSVAGSGGNHE